MTKKGIPHSGNEAEANGVNLIITKIYKIYDNNSRDTEEPRGKY